MAMAQNTLAFDTFAKLTPAQKQKLIKDSSAAATPGEMQQLVDNMTDEHSLDNHTGNSSFL